MMDRSTTRKDADARTTRIALPGADVYLPPSRRVMLDRAVDALALGPILITGDAGSGKTWMVRRLTALVLDSRWMTVDLTPHDGPAELHRHLARGLGLDPAGAGRIEILEALEARSLDGERYSLVIDEAQNLAPTVWEEVRVLANRLDQPDGLRHLVLVGQTALVRQFATRALAAVESRLVAHLHLRPFDLNEAGAWLALAHPDRDWQAAELEAMHRDAGGNPARLRRRSLTIATRLDHHPALTSSAQPAIVAAGEELPASAPAIPSAGARPPLHVADNSIEVGWSSDEHPPSALGQPDDEQIAAHPDEVEAADLRLEETDQAVHDHYAALQAWREWANNQERRHQPVRSDRDLADEIDEAAALEAADSSVVASLDRGSVRTEGQQPFAPFGQLFSRMVPHRDPGTPRP